MALTGLNLARSEWYESDLDPAKGTDNATKFKLGTLDKFIMSRIQDAAMSFEDGADGNVETRVKMNQANIDFVRFGLKDWDNFLDDSGKKIKLKTKKESVGGREYDVVTDECIERLSPDLVAELAGRIRNVNSVSQGEAKNSNGEPSPSS